MLGNIKRISRDTRGFTIVELNITILLLALMGITLLSIFGSFIVNSTRTNYMIEMTNDSQNLLRVMVEELRYGAGVRQTNTIDDANAPGGGWNTDDTNFVIITAVPALDTGNDYIIDVATGEPYMNEFVYYRQGSFLYKRTLANPDALGNRFKTSCPPASATTACPADRKLIETINAMTFTLYDQDNALTTDPLLARSVKIDLTLAKNTFGTPVTFDNSIRTTLRNTF